MSKNSKNFVPTVHQKAGEINRTNPDWRLDLIRNGVPCACCGKIEYPYVNNICDCHSHGLIVCKIRRLQQWKNPYEYPPKERRSHLSPGPSIPHKTTTPRNCFAPI